MSLVVLLLWLRFGVLLYNEIQLHSHYSDYIVIVTCVIAFSSPVCLLCPPFGPVGNHAPHPLPLLGLENKLL